MSAEGQAKESHHQHERAKRALAAMPVPFDVALRDAKPGKLMGYDIALPSALDQETVVEYAADLKTTGSAVVGYTAGLYELYPDAYAGEGVPTFWPHAGKVNKIERTKQVVADQKSIMSYRRYDAFVANLPAHEPAIAAETARYIKAAEADTSADVGLNKALARNAAATINALAEGDRDAMKKALTESTLHLLKSFGFLPEVLQILQHIVKLHPKVPGVAELIALIKLSDDTPDTAEETREHVGRIQAIFQSGRQAMLEKRIGVLSATAATQRDLHDERFASDPRKIPERGFVETALNAAGSGLAYGVAELGVDLVLDRVSVKAIAQELHVAPEKIEAIEGILSRALSVIGMSVAKGAAEAGLEAADIMLHHRSGSLAAGKVLMQAIYELMKPGYSIPEHHHAVERYVLDGYAHRHQAEFAEMYRPVAVDIVFGDVQKEDLGTMRALYQRARAGVLKRDHEREKTERSARVAAHHDDLVRRRIISS